jgi:hypothetical protein
MCAERPRGPGSQPAIGPVESTDSGNRARSGTTRRHPPTPAATRNQAMRSLLRIAVIVGTLIAFLILLAAISPDAAR